MKLAMSQIKLFIVRLLQNYNINKPNCKSCKTGYENSTENKNLADTIETKDVFFNGPVNNIHVSIEKKGAKKRTNNF